jgi:hypothetical protein
MPPHRKRRRATQSRADVGASGGSGSIEWVGHEPLGLLLVATGG